MPLYEGGAPPPGRAFLKIQKEEVPAMPGCAGWSETGQESEAALVASEDGLSLPLLVAKNRSGYFGVSHQTGRTKPYQAQLQPQQQQGLGEAARQACQQQEPQAPQGGQAQAQQEAQQAPAGAQAEQGERSDWVRSSGAAGAQAEQERRRFLRDEERRQLAEAFPQHAAAQPNEAREEGIETAFAQHTASRQFRRGTIGPNEVDYATRVYGGATGAADLLPAGTSLPNSVRTSIWRCAHDDCHGSPKEYPSRDSVRNHCKRQHRA